MRRVIRHGRRVHVVGETALHELEHEQRTDDENVHDTERPAPADINRSASTDLWDDSQLELDQGEGADRDIDEGELASDELDIGARRHAAGFAGKPGANRTAVRWGDSNILTFNPPGQSAGQSAQLIQTKLPRPMICSVRFTAELLSPAQLGGPLAQLDVSTLELIAGVGSAKSIITRSWLNQPSPLGNLDVIIPNIPIETLLATVSAVATADGKPLQVRYALAIAPTVMT